MKIRKSTILLAPVMLALLLAACEDSFLSCLHGNGIAGTETRELDEFSGIVTEGSFEVYYIPDTACFMVLETDQNLIPYIRDRVSGGVLYVDKGTRKCLRSEYPIQIFVHAPEVRLMRLSGSGTVNAESVYSPELNLQLEGSGVFDIGGIDVLNLQVLITGSGEVNVRGKADVSSYVITGSGTISAQDLLSENCKAEITGSGTIYCYATTTLKAIISGSGNILYRGNPRLSTSISGSGTIRTMN